MNSKLSLLFILIGMAPFARADWNGYQPGYPIGFSCMSVSHYLPFVAQDAAELMARTRAIQACQANPQTNNAECASNVQCAPVSPSWQTVSCETTSNNLPFVASGADEMRTKAQVITQCEANPQTNNAFCFENASCTEQYPNPYQHYSCMATSNSLVFATSGDSNDVTSANAIRLCQANPQTVNAQCLQSVTCEQVPPGTAGYACTTSSGSLPFALEERGKYRFDVLADVVRQCQANPQTVNSQCFANAICEPLWGAISAE